MSHDSAPDLLALHAVRVVGFADTPALARRFALDPGETQEHLLDAQACGWVARSAFADLAGWSLTASGRARDEHLLADELAHVEGGDEVRAAHEAFLPLNARLQRACTDWQLRPAAGDALAPNDHADAAWDGRVLDELAEVEQGLVPLVHRLAGILTRFRGYDTRFAAALFRARAGDGGWVDRTDVDSCHRVWFELHEDLVATLGADRGAPA
ncbi:transcriptional regulator [Cellulomonas wangsupingiae]|uniref:Transcriptional regulator n=1 Tax=Cellulomonas wangsupingiae TaxID=2968085 RepID=A0ABY5K6N2_9CELL|nr:transcriptional regulator [Cellulomonas wangsupingiae]MCC2334949.1 transcriptional regulator [Cellulomonas wangsupingiae]UUI65448.1 transcriptional regulator [Cellulomonas wangsupingiae]